MHPEYREQWGRAGYGLHMGSAEVVPPPPPQLFRVYHLTSSQHAVSDIALGRLKVATFSDLNDPFEMLSVNIANPRTRSLISGYKAMFGKDTGLLCFSQNWTSPVLWSHYGGQHTGICLGFNVPRTKLSGVNYESVRSDVDDSNLNIDPILQHRLISTKFEHWSYEQEVRMMVALNSATREGRLFFRPFDVELTLAEVILGPNCSLTVDNVRGLTSKLYPSAVVFGSRLAVKTFAIVPEESTVP